MNRRISVSVKLLLAWLLCTIAGTLAPFNPVAHPAVFKVFEYGSYERDPVDFLLNIVLFLPLGVLFHHEGRRRSLSRRWIVLVIVTAAALISMTVEYLQAFLPDRDSSLLDVVANTGGALIGIPADVAWGTSVAAGVARWRARTSTALLGELVGSLLVIGLLVSAALQVRTRLSNWSEEYPLLIGNELTGDRPWRGRVFRISMADAAASPAAVRRFSAGEPIVSAGTPMTVFDLTGTPPFRDETGHLPDIVPTDAFASVTAEGVAGSSFWLRSDGPASALAQRVRQTNAFTLLVQCATDDTNQDGPARIVSNSASPLLRNFTLGQQGGDLVFRLRTPATGVNGYPLEVVVPEAFSTRDRRQILVSYDGATLLVAMAHRQYVSRTELTPGGSVASGIESLNVRADQLHVYQLAYIAALTVVPGVLVGLLGHTSRERRVIGLGWVVAFALLLEVTLARSSGRAFDWDNVAAAAAVGAMVFTASAVAFSQADLTWRQAGGGNVRYRTT